MSKFDNTKFSDIIDTIFSLNDRQKSLDLIDHYSKFWMQVQSGSQGFSGKKTVNSNSKFLELFDGDSVKLKVEKKTKPDSVTTVEDNPLFSFGG